MQSSDQFRVRWFHPHFSICLANYYISLPLEALKGRDGLSFLVRVFECVSRCFKSATRGKVRLAVVRRSHTQTHTRRKHENLSSPAGQ